ncbi:MAG: hypothetical protein RIS41_1029 [Actinomycetota bacterium]|jgi:hypothetical protein
MSGSAREPGIGLEFGVVNRSLIGETVVMQEVP